MRRIVLPVAVAAAALSLALTACSSSKARSANTSTATTATSSATAPAGSSSAPAGASGQSAHITISGFAYSGDLTVTPGETIVVTDKDSVAHTLTGKTGGFDSGNVSGNGGTATLTAPAQAGSYALICHYHPNMHGTLTVKS
jgi:plastocyanin